jgi:hypothetical protein
MSVIVWFAATAEKISMMTSINETSAILSQKLKDKALDEPGMSEEKLCHLVAKKVRAYASCARRLVCST